MTPPDNTTPPEDNSMKITIYTDVNDDNAYIPADFTVSEKNDEQIINSGLVVICPDGSEFVWIPTTVTALSVRDFGSYVLTVIQFLITMMKQIYPNIKQW